jgi:hypothetical protein
MQSSYLAVLYKSRTRPGPKYDRVVEKLHCLLYDKSRKESPCLAMVEGDSLQELIDGCMNQGGLRHTIPDRVETIGGIRNLKRREGHFRDELEIPLEIDQLLEFNRLYSKMEGVRQNVSSLQFAQP